MKAISKTSCYIVFFIIACMILFIYVMLNNRYEQQCLNNNGTAIYNEFGRFEKCVRDK